MALLIVERLKEQFGKDKEAVELYEQVTGKDVSCLYKDTFCGDNVQKGALFEFYVFKQLYKLKGNHKFLFNVILPTETGTTEIDVLFIHETGIYVYECKSYSGKIYGNEKYKMWNQYLDGKKNQFYSPILQNKGHIKNLQKFLSEKESENIFSFIAFSGRAEVKVEFEPKRLFVGVTDDCIIETKILLKKLEVKFTNEEIVDIYNRLEKYMAKDNVQKEAHIEYVKKVQKNACEE